MRPDAEIVVEEIAHICKRLRTDGALEFQISNQ
jgi:hypothetical protein